MDKDNIKIRSAGKDDVKLIIRYIKELADYENELNQVCVDEEVLKKEMFEKQGAEAFIAEISQEPVGFALFHRSFSTFLGKAGIMLVDLYVEPNSRGRGCGKKMLAQLAHLTKNNEMERLEWWVHDWNSDAAAHYKNWGALQVPDIRIYRLCGDALTNLAKEGFCSPSRERSLLFETERLRILKAREEDIKTIIDFESDTENRDYLWVGTQEEHRNEIHDPNHELVVFEEKEEKEIIGYALNRLDYTSKKWELRRIAIAKKQKGYGKEAMLGLLKYAFLGCDMNRFWLDVYPDNLIGIKLYEGLGMHCDGRLRQNYKSQRGYLDQIIYSMLREEYKG